jgi:hypothetical protein
MNQPPALPLKALQGAVRIASVKDDFCLAGLEDDSFDSTQRTAKPTKVLSHKLRAVSMGTPRGDTYPGLYKPD